MNLGEGSGPQCGFLPVVSKRVNNLPCSYLISMLQQPSGDDGIQLFSHGKRFLTCLLGEGSIERVHKDRNNNIPS